MQYLSRSDCKAHCGIGAVSAEFYIPATHRKPPFATPSVLLESKQQADVFPNTISENQIPLIALTLPGVNKKENNMESEKTISEGTTSEQVGSSGKLGSRSATCSRPPPPRRPTRTDTSAEPMLSRSSSFPSVKRRTREFFGRNGRRQERVPPVDPAVPTIEEEEGAPVPRGARVEGEVDDILQTLFQQKGFPEFDSLGSYLAPTEGEATRTLWQKEAERLLHFAKDPKILLRFSDQTFFKEGDEKGYNDLSRLSERIMGAISVCLLDNECINIEYCSKLSSRDKLSKLIQQVIVGQTSEVETEDSLEAMYSLIDYISAVLARLITQTAAGDYWQTNLLGVLAKHVTKIKILLLDMHTNVAIVVRASEAALDKSQSSGRVSLSALDDEEDCEEALRIINANRKEGLTSAEDAEVASYCVNQTKFRSGINQALRYILVSLRCLDRSGLPATEYEICAVVYETGFEGFKVCPFQTSPQFLMQFLTALSLQALLFQDRDQEYSATSDLDTLNTAHSAFSILNETVLQLAEANRAEYRCNLETTVDWAFADSGGASGLDLDSLLKHKRRLPLKSMEDIITVMVPLVTTSPVLVANFTSFRTMMALTGNVKDVVRPYAEGQFNAFFRVNAGQIDNKQRRGVLHLSQAVLDRCFSRCRLMTGKLEPDDAKLSQKFDKLTRHMDTWVIDEISVTVQCGWYVWPVIIAAVALAGGGLAFGLSAGQLITGVDPSNIAMYTWVLAAFIVLICKSVMVNDWTWSDFLHRRVRCFSVSELEAVTKINPQLIMAKLLHDEGGGSLLKTRGPFNSVFMNRSSDGFSIDQPIDINTILLSGLTLLKVVTPRGHALVCLDSRRGTDLKVVEHQGNQSKEFLVCEDVNQSQQRAKEGNGSGGQKQRLQLTRTSNFKWKRVQGVFVMDSEFV